MEELNTDTATSEKEPVKKKKESRGILILALGHANYGHMAYTLAASIKALSPDEKIAICYTPGVFSKVSETDLHKQVDQLIPCPKSYIEGGNYIRAKAYLYDISPFDKTLFLDADMIWSNFLPAHQLLNELEKDKVKFTCMNEGYISMEDFKGELTPGYTFWAEPVDIKERFINYKNIRSGKMYQTRTELLYFVKSEKNAKLFETVKTVYDGHGVKMTAFAKNKTPDELAYNIALCIHGIEPHRLKWAPVYWHWRHASNRMQLYNVAKHYYAYSIGGALLRPPVKAQYDIMAGAVFKKLGIRNPYSAKAKYQFLPERNLRR